MCPFTGQERLRILPAPGDQIETGDIPGKFVKTSGVLKSKTNEVQKKQNQRVVQVIRS